nr:MAG TPA: hypothetical protein [Caudoviricetes sp.]
MCLRLVQNFLTSEPLCCRHKGLFDRLDFILVFL